MIKHILIAFCLITISFSQKYSQVKFSGFDPGPGEILIDGIIKWEYLGKYTEVRLDTAYFRKAVGDKKYIHQIIIPIKGTEFLINYHPDFYGGVEFLQEGNSDLDAYLYANDRNTFSLKDSVCHTFLFAPEKEIKISSMGNIKYKSKKTKYINLPGVDKIDELHFSIKYRFKDFEGANNVSNFKPEEVRIMNFASHVKNTFDEYRERLIRDVDKWKYKFLEDLLQGETDPMVQLKIIYDFISYNFNYSTAYKQDPLLKELLHNKPKLSQMFNTCRGICRDFSLLMHRLASFMFISIYDINGVIIINNKDNFTDQTIRSLEKHAWTRIMFNWEWYICDPTTNVGNIKIPDQKDFRFNNVFLVKENYAEKFYYPDLPMYGSNHPPDLNKVEVEKLTKINDILFLKGFKILTPLKEIEIIKSDPFVFTLKIPDDAKIAGYLLDESDKKYKRIYPESSGAENSFLVQPENPGDYSFVLYGKINGKSERLLEIPFRKK